MREDFDWGRLSLSDKLIADEILGGNGVWPKPDLVIAPDNAPYIYRWHVIPRNQRANVYFHIQVADDPERPLHDHPWDNMSVILAGGYDEHWNPTPRWGHADLILRKWRKDDTVHRRAGEAHHLYLPKEFPYAMTLFSTGPVIRDWGFWYPNGWRSADIVTTNIGNRSIHLKEEVCTCTGLAGEIFTPCPVHYPEK